MSIAIESTKSRRYRSRSRGQKKESCSSASNNHPTSRGVGGGIGVREGGGGGQPTTKYRQQPNDENDDQQQAFISTKRLIDVEARRNLPTAVENPSNKATPNMATSCDGSQRGEHYHPPPGTDHSSPSQESACSSKQQQRMDSLDESSCCSVSESSSDSSSAASAVSSLSSSHSHTDSDQQQPPRRSLIPPAPSGLVVSNNNSLLKTNTLTSSSATAATKFRPAVEDRQKSAEASSTKLVAPQQEDGESPENPRGDPDPSDDPAEHLQHQQMISSSSSIPPNISSSLIKPFSSNNNNNNSRRRGRPPPLTVPPQGNDDGDGGDQNSIIIGKICDENNFAACQTAAAATAEYPPAQPSSPAGPNHFRQQPGRAPLAYAEDDSIVGGLSGLLLGSDDSVSTHSAVGTGSMDEHVGGLGMDCMGKGDAGTTDGRGYGQNSRYDGIGSIRPSARSSNRRRGLLHHFRRLPTPLILAKKKYSCPSLSTPAAAPADSNRYNNNSINNYEERELLNNYGSSTCVAAARSSESPAAISAAAEETSTMENRTQTTVLNNSAVLSKVATDRFTATPQPLLGDYPSVTTVPAENSCLNPTENSSDASTFTTNLRSQQKSSNLSKESSTILSPKTTNAEQEVQQGKLQQQQQQQQQNNNNSNNNNPSNNNAVNPPPSSTSAALQTQAPSSALNPKLPQTQQPLTLSTNITTAAAAASSSSNISNNNNNNNHQCSNSSISSSIHRALPKKLNSGAVWIKNPISTQITVSQPQQDTSSKLQQQISNGGTTKIKSSAASAFSGKNSVSKAAKSAAAVGGGGKTGCVASKHSNHTEARGGTKTRYKLVKESTVQLCRLHHPRTVIGKLSSSKLLRRWESHDISLKRHSIVSKTPIGFMERPITYTEIEDIHVLPNLDSNEKFCLRIFVPEGSVLLHTKQIYSRNQWMHSIIWRRQLVRINRILQSTNRPEIILKEIKGLVEMAIASPLEDDTIYLEPVQMVGSVINQIYSGQHERGLLEPIITCVSVLLETVPTVAEICPMLSKYCQEYPRCGLVEHVFANVALQALKKNMDFGKYPAARVFVQNFLLALLEKNNGLQMIKAFVNRAHGVGMTCPHPRVLPNLVSASLAGLLAAFPHSQSYQPQTPRLTEWTPSESFDETELTGLGSSSSLASESGGKGGGNDAEGKKGDGCEGVSIGERNTNRHRMVDNSNVGGLKNINVLRSHPTTNPNHVTHKSFSDKFRPPPATRNLNSLPPQSPPLPAAPSATTTPSAVINNSTTNTNNSTNNTNTNNNNTNMVTDSIKTNRLTCFSYVILTMAELEDWRLQLASILQPLPFPEPALSNPLFVGHFSSVFRLLASDPRCQVHLAILGVRDGKEGWFHLFCPGGPSCLDDGQLFVHALKNLLECCCKRKKFLESLCAMLGPLQLLALREKEPAMEALCHMLEMEVVSEEDVKLQMIMALQSTSQGKQMYAQLCDRQIALRELQEKGGPRKLTLPSWSTDGDLAVMLSSGSFGNLEWLSLAFTNVTSTCADYLIKLPSLRYLNLWSTQFNDVGLEIISEHLPKLQVLNLCETPVTDKGLLSLQALKSVRKLNLNSTKLSLETFQVLREKLPMLQEVDIRYTEAWSAEDC